MSISWGDLVKVPTETLTAPFKKREGQPWVQGTARNWLHAFLPDNVANDFQYRNLSDTAEGNRYAGSDSNSAGALAAAGGGTGASGGAAAPGALNFGGATQAMSAMPTQLPQGFMSDPSPTQSAAPEGAQKFQTLLALLQQRGSQ